MTEETKKPTGRPTTFSQEIVDEICERIAEGESLRSICKNDPKMPAMSSVFKWLSENKDFSEQYARAREVQAESMAEEIFEIADDGSNDLMTITKKDYSYEMENKEVTSRSKLRVEARQWYLGKIIPKKYGTKTTLAGDPDNPLIVPIIKDDI